MSEELNAYMDEAGRIHNWPTKKRKLHQQLILEYLAGKFEMGRQYSEKEVNAILNQYHTFEDWALLRRELIERRLLSRSKDGSAYWRTSNTSIEE